MLPRLTIVAITGALAAVGGCGERVPAPNVHGAAQVMGAGPQLRDGIDDTRIVSQIQQAFRADAELGQFVIDVDSKEGLVVLSGVTPSAGARARAVEIAKGTPQVHGIANQLTVKQG
jgi:osmotically-inducible protein OsmY